MKKNTLFFLISLIFSMFFSFNNVEAASNNGLTKVGTRYYLLKRENEYNYDTIETQTVYNNNYNNNFSNIGTYYECEGSKFKQYGNGQCNRVNRNNNYNNNYGNTNSSNNKLEQLLSESRNAISRNDSLSVYQFNNYTNISLNRNECNYKYFLGIEDVYLVNYDNQTYIGSLYALARAGKLSSTNNNQKYNASSFKNITKISWLEGYVGFEFFDVFNVSDISSNDVIGYNNSVINKLKNNQNGFGINVSWVGLIGSCDSIKNNTCPNDSDYKGFNLTNCISSNSFEYGETVYKCGANVVAYGTVCDTSCTLTGYTYSCDEDGTLSGTNCIYPNSCPSQYEGTTYCYRKSEGKFSCPSDYKRSCKTYDNKYKICTCKKTETKTTYVASYSGNDTAGMCVEKGGTVDDVANCTRAGITLFSGRVCCKYEKPKSEDVTVYTKPSCSGSSYSAVNRDDFNDSNYYACRKKKGTTTEAATATPNYSCYNVYASASCVGGHFVTYTIPDTNKTRRVCVKELEASQVNAKCNEYQCKRTYCDNKRENTSVNITSCIKNKVKNYNLPYKLAIDSCKVENNCIEVCQNENEAKQKVSLSDNQYIQYKNCVMDNVVNNSMSIDRAETACGSSSCNNKCYSLNSRRVGTTNNKDSATCANLFDKSQSIDLEEYMTNTSNNTAQCGNNNSAYGSLVASYNDNKCKLYCKQTATVTLPGSISSPKRRGSYFEWPMETGKNNMQVVLKDTCRIFTSVVNATTNCDLNKTDIENKLKSNYKATVSIRFDQGSTDKYIDTNLSTNSQGYTNGVLSGDSTTNRKPSDEKYFTYTQTIKYKLPSTLNRYYNRTTNSENANTYDRGKGYINVPFDAEISDNYELKITEFNLGRNNSFGFISKDYICKYKVKGYIVTEDCETNPNLSICKSCNGICSSDKYITSSDFNLVAYRKKCSGANNQYCDVDFKCENGTKDVGNPKLCIKNYLSKKGYSTDDLSRLGVNVIYEAMNSCSKKVCKINGTDKIVYRTIDLKNPFPGMKGNTRISGYNWSKNDITNKIQNSNTTQASYVIDLTPNDIKKIRQYNKNNQYSDFKLICYNNSNNCISKFLRGQVSGYRNYISSGTCKNISSSNYESCMK